MYDYFEIQAKIGITKHMGGMEATRKLLKMCRVDKTDYVLVVGSGNGVYALKIQKMTGCKILGMDISEDMVLRAQEKLEPQEKKVEFQVGNAENLDFPDGTFDVVISESVTGFTDKNQSISEYYRVLKSGGYVGLNEVTWLLDPSPELDRYCKRVMGLVAETNEEWSHLLDKAGFKDIKSSTHVLSQWKQVKSDLELQSMDFFRIWGRFFKLYFKEPEYRRSVHNLTWEAMHLPRGFDRYFGYGIYVGRK